MPVFEKAFYAWSLVLLFLVLNIEAQRFFSSSSASLALLKSEKLVVEMLNDYIQETHHRIAFIQKYVDQYKEFYRTVDSANIQENELNPIDNYLLLKRTTTNLDEVEHSLRMDSSLDLLQNFDVMRQREELPIDSDLQGAAMGLLRLQMTYRLDPKALSNGFYRNDIINIVPNTRNTSRLTDRDCVYLGHNLVNIGMLDKALEWYGMALSQRKPIEDGFSKPMLVQEIKNYIEDANKLLKNTSREEEGILESLDGVLDEMDDSDNFAPTLYYEDTDEEHEREQFRRLCRGEQMRPLSWDKDLHCQYFKGYHPFYRLQPLKVETVSDYPFIAVIHDLIGDKEISEFQNLAFPYLERSTHYGNDGEFHSTFKRTSNNAWIPVGLSPLIDKISRNTEMAFGLMTDELKGGSEMYQVANYGIGGHYAVHHDYVQTLENGSYTFMRDDDKNNGDRIATLMFYLTDVEAGGATVFPLIGKAVRPKKGSAVFWWNLRPNGDGDPMTTHGACPVLYGSKWISNKWFRSSHQMFFKKCGLEPEAVFTGF